MIQVENYPNLMKNNGLVVDVDKSNYNRYMAQKNSTNKLASLENEINTIKDDMTEIKYLLTKLISNKE